tara:strand:+ start:1073 stop:2659 length:1587 start_codon:yes stop_codon:yes gene_type:complete
MQNTPRIVALKLVQGLTMIHGLSLTEIDHRAQRHQIAFKQLSNDNNPVNPGDINAIPITSIGTKYLGENKSNGLGTLLGYSVSMAGNVDGLPGFEIVAGGYEFTDDYAERGMAILLSDKRDPIKIFGPPQPRAWFGHSVANNGDSDGDGLNDVLVGARFANQRSGAAYLFSSKRLKNTSGPIEASVGPGIIEFITNSTEAELGFEVYFGDDWDNDRKSEIIIRANLEGYQSGGAYVVYSSKLTEGTLNLGQGIYEIEITVDDNYADLARSISTIGDVDGDGLDELLLGSQTASAFFGEKKYAPSRSYIAMSKDLSLQKSIGLNDLYIIQEVRNGDQLGSCSGRLGDLNGDDIDDFVIGARSAENQRGALYIISGKEVATKLTSGKVTNISELNPIVIVGEQEGDLLGWSCAEKNADFNIDGIVDVTVGARNADGAVSKSGAVYIISGAMLNSFQSQSKRPLTINIKNALKIGGDRHGAQLGSKRRFSVGLFDNDAIPDLAVGTPGLHEGGVFAGALWIISGNLIRSHF